MLLLLLFFFGQAAAYNAICDLDIAVTYNVTATHIHPLIHVSGFGLGSNPGRDVDSVHPFLLSTETGVTVATVLDFTQTVQDTYRVYSSCFVASNITVQEEAGITGSESIGISVITTLVGSPVTWNTASMSIMGNTHRTWRQHFADPNIASCSLPNCATPFTCVFPVTAHNYSLDGQLTFEQTGVGLPAILEMPACFDLLFAGLLQRVCLDDLVCVYIDSQPFCRPRVYTHALNDTVFIGIEQGTHSYSTHWDSSGCSTVGVAWAEHTYTVSAWAPFIATIIVSLAWVVFPLETHVPYIDRRALVLTLSVVLTFSSVYSALVRPTLAHRLCRSNMFLLSHAGCTAVASLALATQLMSVCVLAGGLWWDSKGTQENRQAQFYHLFLHYNIMLSLAMQSTGGTLHGLNNYLAACFGGIALFSLARVMTSFSANGSRTTVIVALCVLPLSFPCITFTAFVPTLYALDDSYTVLVMASIRYALWIIFGGMLYQIMSYVQHNQLKIKA